MTYQTRSLKFVFLLLILCCYYSPPIVAQESKVERLPDCRLRFAVSTEASKERIWSLWEDVENWKVFDILLEYAKLDDGDTFGLGAKGEIKAKGSPKTRFEITAYKAGESFTETLKVPLYQTIDLHRYFQKSENGETIFVHEVQFKGRLKWLIYWIAANTFEEELPKVMGRLKIVAEDVE